MRRGRLAQDGAAAASRGELHQARFVTVDRAWGLSRHGTRAMKVQQIQARTRLKRPVRRPYRDESSRRGLGNKLVAQQAVALKTLICRQSWRLPYYNLTRLGPLPDTHTRDPPYPKRSGYVLETGWAWGPSPVCIIFSGVTKVYRL